RFASAYVVQVIELVDEAGRPSTVIGRLRVCRTQRSRFVRSAGIWGRARYAAARHRPEQNRGVRPRAGRVIDSPHLSHVTFMAQSYPAPRTINAADLRKPNQPVEEARSKRPRRNGVPRTLRAPRKPARKRCGARQALGVGAFCVQAA